MVLIQPTLGLTRTALIQPTDTLDSDMVDSPTTRSKQFFEMTNFVN